MKIGLTDTIKGNMELNEKQAVSMLMSNLKNVRHKTVNLIEFSDACNLLIQKWGIKEVSRYFNVSQYMLRQIEKITRLDFATKKYVQKHGLGIEKSYQLWRIDESRRQELLPLIRNLTAADVKNLAYIIRHEPTKSTQECKKIFDEKYVRETTVLVLALPPDLASRLNQITRQKKMKVTTYVTKLIERECYE